jgi:4-oxalocrotonate tautomerase
MPVISIELGPVSNETKAHLIEEITKTASSVTGIPESTFIVLIKEYPLNAIGVGGIQLSERK